MSISETLRQWWHMITPKPFYQCYTHEGIVSGRRHPKQRSARIEGVKKASELQVPVFIMRAVDVVLPQPEGAEKTMKIHSYEGRPSILTDYPHHE